MLKSSLLSIVLIAVTMTIQSSISLSFHPNHGEVTETIEDDNGKLNHGHREVRKLKKSHKKGSSSESHSKDKGKRGKKKKKAGFSKSSFHKSPNDIETDGSRVHKKASSNKSKSVGASMKFKTLSPSPVIIHSHEKAYNRRESLPPGTDSEIFQSNEAHIIPDAIVKSPVQYPSPVKETKGHTKVISKWSTSKGPSPSPTIVPSVLPSKFPSTTGPSILPSEAPKHFKHKVDKKTSKQPLVKDKSKSLVSSPAQKSLKTL